MQVEPLDDDEPTTADVDKKKKKRKKGEPTYAMYLHKILKARHKDASASKEAMGVMNALVVHLEGKLTNKSFALAKFEKKSTLDRRHVHGAARLVLPSALAGRAVKEGLMAVERFGAPAAEVAA